MAAAAVYTDGACIGTEPRRVAGYGVYWGKDDPRNISASLLGMPQTNQRAELAAIVHALEQIVTDRVTASPSIVIYSDSQYSIKCITEWRKRWQQNGWRTAAGKNVLNDDLIRRAGDLYDAAAGRVRLEWVKGHGTSAGNNAADALATRAAALAAALT